MKKEHTPIVITGHVDHGKSTLIGRLLFDTNSLPKDKVAEIKRFCWQLGKELELAYVTDQLEEERSGDLTIDTTQIFLKTRTRNYCIIDTPGHLEFIKNMITGATLAKAAVLIIDINEGVMDQTRRHIYLLNLVGIKHLIVAVNKMDLLDYRREDFDRLKKELSSVLQDVGIGLHCIIPISAKKGENISSKSAYLDWYKGPTLLEAFDSLELKQEEGKRPLRFPVQDIYDIESQRIIVGRVASGQIKKGDKVILLPLRKQVEVAAIRAFGEDNKKRFVAGENIGIVLNNHHLVKRGDIIASREDPLEPTSYFRGNIFWMADRPLRVKERVVLRCANQQVTCIVENIERRINPVTIAVTEGESQIHPSEAGIILFKAEKPIFVEDFSYIEELGRFVIESGYNLQGIGIITDPHIGCNRPISATIKNYAQ